MANKKITEFTELISVASGDFLPIVDVSDTTDAATGTTKKITQANLTTGLLTTASTDTLSNKSISFGSNTITGTTAQFNTALSDGDFATLAGTEALTNKTLTSPVITTPSAFTTGGTITLAENTSIALDPAGSADGTYSGETVTGIGGATIAFGDLITLDKDDSRWELVDISVAAAATGDARGLIGMAVTSSTDGGALTILLKGIIRSDANFPTLTIGAPVYASTTGDVVVAQPTTTDYVIRIMGYGMTADEMRFDPGNTWTTHT